MNSGWSGKRSQSLNVPHSQREKPTGRGSTVEKCILLSREAYLVVLIFPAMSHGHIRTNDSECTWLT